MSQVRYKIGFTINAETLFTLASKLLPIEDFSMEEMIERPAPDPAIRFDRRFDLPPKPKKKPHTKAPRKPGYKLNPDAGVNKILLDMLADGRPHHVAEADGMIKEAGYSPNGMYSRILRLEKHGFVFQPRKGLWQLISKKESA